MNTLCLSNVWKKVYAQFYQEIHPAKSRLNSLLICLNKSLSRRRDWVEFEFFSLVIFLLKTELF